MSKNYPNHQKQMVKLRVSRGTNKLTKKPSQTKLKPNLAFYNLTQPKLTQPNLVQSCLTQPNQTLHIKTNSHQFTPNQTKPNQAKSYQF